MKIEMSSLDVKQTHDLLTGSIAPLPIALISTLGADGIYNAAPYSLVLPISWKPPLVCVSIGSKKGEKKDTLANIQFTKDFVINIMGDETIKPAIKAAGNYPSHVDEIEKVGLTAMAAETVKSPLIKEARVSIECRLSREMVLGEGENIRWIIFGEVVLVHIKDGIWTSGKVDPAALRAVGRMGDGIYCRTTDAFTLLPG
jgi:flavin reductase (DIM6/NTAB) family NADH-FMN oxidoreductase RutF